MAERVLMIALSPTMEEGKIISWSKKPGDELDTGDVLCEVETDKASMEYESAQEGVLLHIVKGEGDSARVGDTIAIAGEAGEDFADLLKEIETEAVSAPAASAPDPTSEVATSNTPDPAQSVASVKPQQAVTTVVKATAIAAKAAGPGAATVPVIGDSGRVKASPLARKLAQEKAIDIRLVPGSGPQGRVVVADVEAYNPTAAVHTVDRSISTSPGAAFGGLEEKTVPVSTMRSVIAKRLAESKFQAPHFYLKSGVYMEELIQARGIINKGRDAASKVSFNAFIMKFAAQALVAHPSVNSGWQGDSIRYFGSADIGLAVAVGEGLITPIVRNCEAKSIAQIDEELKVLIEKARAGALSPDEYTGASFTISNLGSFGVEEFTAIINPPGSAILALGKTQKVPVVGANDELEIRSEMKMTLSCDHRTIDGAVGAGFLSTLKAYMEEPVRVLF